MKYQPQVLIIGGGLAGLTAAIHLSLAGKRVVVLEKHAYPRHKVCGEFVSNEVRPYLNALGISPESYGCTEISETSISATSGKTISSRHPGGGFGISRFVLDKIMADRALETGAEIIITTVQEITFASDAFTAITSHGVYEAPVLLGAFGKRSNIDVKLKRSFISARSYWLAVKMHYRGDYPERMVGLHSFRGGYCGISKVENDLVNVCYLADYESFKKYRDTEAYEREVVCKNPALAALMQNFQPVFEKPLVISQVSFAAKKPVEDHILMIGDTAGLIHPLCGNGMAMAVHGSKIACELVVDYLEQRLSRSKMETLYERRWRKTFGYRLRAGYVLAAIMRSDFLTSLLMKAAINVPGILPFIISRTHGKPLNNKLAHA